MDFYDLPIGIWSDFHGISTKFFICYSMECGLLSVGFLFDSQECIPSTKGFLLHFYM